MIASGHSRYRRQLSLIAGDAEILRIANECDWRSPERNWHRIHDRFQPDIEPYAVAVFEAEGSPRSIYCVEIFACPPREQASGTWVEHRELGHIRFTPFTSDRSLETLRTVLAAHPRALVLRYRPLRRCTIRVQEGDSVHIGKVYPRWAERRNRGQQILAEGQALWCSARRAELNFSVARPEKWDSEMRTLWQECVDGTSVWPCFLGQNGDKFAFHLGASGASLTCSRSRPARTFDAGAQLAASGKYARELVRRVPRAGAQVEHCLGRLQKIHDRAATARKLRPVHGDMAPGQWLVDGSKLYLLDFDDFAWGDPELDVATFLQELEIDMPSSVREEICGAFLSGYQTIAGRLDPNLIAAYVCHKRLYKALSRARGLRPDGDALALESLHHACESLRSAEEAC